MTHSSTALFRLILNLPFLLPFTQARSITVTNSCSSTIWPGINTGVGTVPSQATGWELAAGASTTFDVPDNWTAGRIWARTGCTTLSNGVFTCLTGNCGAGTGGSILCDGSDQPPATLAEFTLNANGVDNYDISLVDGFNVPLNIVPAQSVCPAPECSGNINAVCPAILRTGIDSTGTNFACAHPCNVGFGEEKYGNRDCCTGAYSNSTLCQACGVDFYNVFKDQCNMAYAYAYDEKSGTALWTCSTLGDYSVVFCPDGSNFEGTSNSDVSNQYASDTATCTSIATTFSTTFAVSPSPSVPITSGTLSVVATNSPGVGGQAAIGITASSSLSPGQTGFPGGSSLAVSVGSSTSSGSSAIATGSTSSGSLLVDIATGTGTPSQPSQSSSHGPGSCKGNPHDGGVYLHAVPQRHKRRVSMSV